MGGDGDAWGVVMIIPPFFFFFFFFGFELVEDGNEFL